MKKIIVSILVVFLLSTVPLSIGGKEAADGKTSGGEEFLLGISNDDSLQDLHEPYFVIGEVIVKFRDKLEADILVSPEGVITTSIESIDRLNKKYGVSFAEKLFGNDSIPLLSNVCLFNISGDMDVLSAVEEYNSDPRVEFAEPNYVYHICEFPNDPGFNKQWALHNTGQTGGTEDADIDAPEAWNIETGDPNVTIAVIDSGVDYTHPDLAANIWVNSGEDLNGNGIVDPPDFNGIDDDQNGYIDDIRGWNFCDNDNDPMDEYNGSIRSTGHGTHCAGIIGAVGNNGIGISGVCWNCKIMPVKVRYTVDGIAAAIVYAVDNGADVISMSFAGPASLMNRNAIDYAYNKGVVLVAGAGNDFKNWKQISYPAAYDNVIAVAATNHDDEKARLSNYGSWVDIAAPGIDIYSTLPHNRYGKKSGTSMACPYVAGLAGLLLSKNHSLNPDMVKTIILGSADEIDSTFYIGHGRINAYEAIQREPAIAILNSFPKGGDVNGVINITGKAWGESFQYYTIEYGRGRNPDSWIEITNSTNASILDGVLASLNTTEIEEGLYTVKLKVVCNDAVYLELIFITVNNHSDLFIVDDDDGSGVDYTCIRDAVDDAGNGDKIYVHNGRYYENIMVERSVALTGEDKDNTIIDGGSIGMDVLHISDNADNVTITGFTIQNGGTGVLKDIICHYAGIFVTSNNNTIHGNHITNCDTGIFLAGSYNLIYHNNFVDNRFLNAHVWGDRVLKTTGNYWYNPSLKHGNYWDSYIGFDIFPPWGIGDTPKYIFPFLSGHKDEFPLMHPWDEQPPKDNTDPNVEIIKPVRGLYIQDRLIRKRLICKALIIGDVTIEVKASDDVSGIEKVEFWIDWKLKATDTSAPYTYYWTRDRPRLLFHMRIIKVVVYDNAGNNAAQMMLARRIL